MRIPSALLPVCPHCGKPLTMNLRADQAFVEDAGWRRASERYAAFLRSRRSQRILFLELGVGYNTPGIIKYPFWQMTAAIPAGGLRLGQQRRGRLPAGDQPAGRLHKRRHRGRAPRLGNTGEKSPIKPIGRTAPVLPADNHQNCEGAALCKRRRS